ncbi:MAG: hypothetical protein AAF960_22945 [Bacteroidota bacterium]
MTHNFHIKSLFFWHFFHRIERELSYERWIDKYKLFLTTLESGQIPYEPDYASFKRFCKILYLQEAKHEARFLEILDASIDKERDLLVRLLERKGTPKSDKPTDKKTPPKPTSPPTKPPSKPEKPTSTEGDAPTTPVLHEAQDNTESLFFHPKIQEVNDEVLDENKGLPVFEKFLHQDEYYSVTRREMVKTWQYLRRKEAGGQQGAMDIPKTIRKVVQEGLFLTPVYQKSSVNRKDTLIIFADVRGSMMPLHSLTRRLIQTARGEGGHTTAEAYYFQDYPSTMVYQEDDLSRPIPLKTALRSTNRQATTAIIISDAGASRGGVSKERRRARYNNVAPFLDMLNNCTAQTLWLNPMPRHRWVGTSAEWIATKVTAMIPVLEEKDFDFQNTIRLILKQRVL